jgi:uroporphyrinogen-III synthase
LKNNATILSTKKLNAAIVTQGAEDGFNFIQYEFIKITPHINLAVAEAIGRSKPYLIFTSKQAVSAFSKNKITFGLKLAPKKVFCIEGETLRNVKQLTGVEVVGTAPNAAELANIILENDAIKEVSFICGNKRRDELPAILTQQQIIIHEIIVYATRLVNKKVTETFDAILFFSPSGVEGFLQANKLSKHTPCFCIGSTTAASLQIQGYNNIIIAANSSQQSMLTVLQQYFLEKLKTI